MSSLLAAQKPKTAIDFASSYAANADLDLILKYVARKHPELVKKLPKITQQYRKYMFLIGTGFFNMSVPSEDVDQIWHAHILHTVLYAEFCENVAGRFIHHNLFQETVTKTERKESRQKLLEASLTVFGRNVFQNKGGDCGYCGGCSSCSGPCGGAACGGAGGDISAKALSITQTLSLSKPDCVCNNPISTALIQNTLSDGVDCQACEGDISGGPCC